MTDDGPAAIIKAFAAEDARAAGETAELVSARPLISFLLTRFAEDWASATNARSQAIAKSHRLLVHLYLASAETLAKEATAAHWGRLSTMGTAL